MGYKKTVIEEYTCDLCGHKFDELEWGNDLYKFDFEPPPRELRRIDRTYILKMFKFSWKHKITNIQDDICEHCYKEMYNFIKTRRKRNEG